MNIAVNTRFLLKNKLEGIGWFTYESLKRITTQHPEHHFHFLFDRPFHDEFLFSENITPHVLYPPARHPLLWYWWFERAVPRALNKIKPQLFLSPDGFCSLRTACKQLLVIHDLAFEHYPQHIHSAAASYYRRYTPQYAHKASRIVTVSEFTKNDLVKQYGIDASKIDVAWNGSNELFSPLAEHEKLLVKQQYTHGMDYFIYAGAIQPRKNPIRLFRAFDAFKKTTGAPLKLVLVGRNWNYREAMQVHAAMKHKDDVIFIGHLSRLDLSRLMGGAMALVYVSLFEGFGIPIVEAMNVDVPVITSNTSSMPEVAGEAALLADPFSEQDIAMKMEMLYRRPALRQSLIEKGKVQRVKFNWQNTADQLWNSMKRIL